MSNKDVSRFCFSENTDVVKRIFYYLHMGFKFIKKWGTTSSVLYPNTTINPV